MARCIYVDELVKIYQDNDYCIKMIGTDECDNRLHDGGGCFQCAVDRAPTVDAVPVVHGHWIPKKYMSRTPFARNYICSICGADPIGISNYCPNCGARMDGKENVDENN